MSVERERLASASILFVDNDEKLLNEIRVFFKNSSDLLTHTTTNPEHVMEILNSCRFDAVVSAYRMQQMDGIALLRRLRQSGNQIPFILFTETGRGKVAIDALNGGADFYLVKGHESEAEFTQLRMLISQAVARRRAEDTLLKNMEQFQILNDQIRNPLQAMMFYLELDGKECYPKIKEQIRSINDIVDRLDNACLESMKVRSFLTRHYNCSSLPAGVEQNLRSPIEKGVPP
jgi:DNA-binding response OmpR family regulator